MTYGEAATARSSIGSGLLNHGIPKASCITSVYVIYLFIGVIKLIFIINFS